MSTTEPQGKKKGRDNDQGGGQGADGDDQELGFAAAMAELNTIVTELESDALDVDHLSARVARAAELVELCRGRIDGARFAVEQILGSMEERPSRSPADDDV